MFRQLGLLLIAWHHPHVYARILAGAGSADSSDEAFARVLGMSPTMLGLVLAREWRIAPHIRAAMGDDVPTESEEVRRLGNRLRSFCEIGERLARGQYLTSVGSHGLKEYQDAATQVQLILGSDGLRTIFSQVEAACAHLKASFPGLASSGTEIKKAVRVRSGSKPTRELPEFVRDQLQFLRERFQPGTAPEQLRSVVEQIVRSLGFTRGALFLLEPVQRQLIPRVAWGDQDLKSVRPVHLSLGGNASATDKDRATVGAFETGKLCKCGKGIVQFSVPLGVSEPIGVLVFEMKREFLESREQIIEECAYGVAEAISDALAL